MEGREERMEEREREENFEEDEECWPSDFETDDEDETLENEDEVFCPMITLSREEKERMRRPWSFAVIVKLVGKRISFGILDRRIRLLWKPTAAFDIVDIGNDFHIVRLGNKSDYAKALSGGPWIIVGHYLSVRRWTPDFFPEEAEIDKLCVWARLPGVPMEHFDSTFLWKVGQKIGKVIKVDKNTSLASRGNYARSCVEIDLSKPLLSKYSRKGRIKPIVYESLELVCYECGMFGHRLETCPKGREKEGVEGSASRKTEQRQSAKTMEDLASEKSHGLWMTVHRQRRNQRPPLGDKRGNKSEINGGGDFGNKSAQDSRFDVLEGANNEGNIDPNVSGQSVSVGRSEGERPNWKEIRKAGAAITKEKEENIEKLNKVIIQGETVGTREESNESYALPKILERAKERLLERNKNGENGMVMGSLKINLRTKDSSLKNSMVFQSGQSLEKGTNMDYSKKAINPSLNKDGSYVDMLEANAEEEQEQYVNDGVIGMMTEVALDEFAKHTGKELVSSEVYIDCERKEEEVSIMCKEYKTHEKF